MQQNNKDFDSGSINRNIKSNIDLNTSDILKIKNEDVNKDNDDKYEEYPKEIIQNLKNSAIKRLLSIINGIASNKIKLEKDRRKIKGLLLVFEHNLQLLLERYDNAILQNVIGYYIDLNKVEVIINQAPFENNPPYLFVRDWMLRSEIENTDQKNQLKLKRYLDKHNLNSGSWFHDAVLIMNVNHTEIQVVFRKAIGNAYYHDDVKMKEDCAKILKDKKLFSENDSNLEKLETYGIFVYKRDVFLYSMHCVNGVYIVDQFNGFVVPNTPIQLKNLSNIIRIIITFKVTNLIYVVIILLMIICN
ncbi:6966_t:CDS:2 [Funneliformis mosseae]|uniref:6966_t:CDS:1 n=1 Tax=Funneliformis mosseae TaxID=27381 RepID=A0A9N8WTI7_FUNMO|nr:6966_t:CDS:2 [Funneliformis mosseae]